MNQVPLEQHTWLHQLIGAWDFTSQCVLEPRAEPVVSHGRERVRALGDLWIIAEGEGDTPDGGTMAYIMTLGYDPRTERFVGSWVGSPMAQMFVYEGSLDDAGEVLTLDTTGPDFNDPTKLMRFRDVIELRGESRVQRSLMPDEAVHWQEFNHLLYRRA